VFATARTSLTFANQSDPAASAHTGGDLHAHISQAALGTGAIA
jgi:hypothetical protein